MSRPCVLIAGGGTGGHVFPGVAVAEAMHAVADVDVVFCGTPRGVEARVIPQRGWPLEVLEVEPMKGGGAARALRGAWIAARATTGPRRLRRARRPAVVLGVGGYASGPVSLAAVLGGVPLAILEPNSVAGLSNRLVARFAKRAYLAWPETAVSFPAAAVRPFGVPLRAGFGARPYVASAARRVLVMGGSQGAAALNERMPEVVAQLQGRAGLEVVHQAGRERDGAVREAYARLGLGRVAVVPFIDDVARAIADADLIVARAGASTLAEITAIGRAALLVPFPHAADDHQARNAEALERAGGAVCVRQDAADVARLAREAARLLDDETARVAMASASRAGGRPAAASDVARDLLSLAGLDLRPGRTADGAPPPRPPQEAR